ncbi:hypothetical protein IAG25_35530 [Caballeronia sp. EK]|uniref:hypothetical protein n=1 Tax=Caballeronia sp. EK TaxID=2767469 RepID=UPI0016560426|nr:hypothetical protein [Caballeronia sp. EK]MBC8642119.1 hypothetical protein [Caballeronia sp. EK]
MNVLQLAGALPRDPQFREWIASLDGGTELDHEQCAEFIRLVCQIESRRELISNPDAEKRFHEQLRKPFLEWRVASSKLVHETQ